MSWTAFCMSIMAYGVVGMVFLILFLWSIHERCIESLPGRGTNFFTLSCSGTGQTSDSTKMVLTSGEAHASMSFSFMTGQRNVNSNPGPLPVRYSVLPVSLYRRQGRLCTFWPESTWQVRHTPL